MKLVADEGVDRPIVEQLRRDGHEVLYIAESDSVSATMKFYVSLINMPRHWLPRIKTSASWYFVKVACHVELYCYDSLVSRLL